MGISGPAAFIAAQMQRDMPRDGTGFVDAVSLANAAGVALEALESSLAEAIAELTFHHPETQFSGKVIDDHVMLERKPTVHGLIVFVPADSLGKPQSSAISQDAAGESASRLIASAVSHGDREDAAGRRILIKALSHRPADEVEAILGSALWTKKQQGIRFWAAATKRLKDAADDEAWAKRLGEAQDLMVEQQSKVNMLAVVLAKVKEPQFVEDSLAAGVLPSRVRAEIERRKREKAAKESEEK